MKKKAKPRPRATQSEMSLRVNKVASLLIAGRTRPYVLAYCDRMFGLADRATDELIARATESIRELNADDIEESRAKILGGYYEQYRKLKNSPEAAAGVLDKIAKVQGLHEQTVNLNVNRPLSAATDEELELAAAQLEQVNV